MATKTTGAEYKAYINETSKEWWPEGAYMDDDVLTIDGKSNEDDFSFDYNKIRDEAVVVINYGSYFASPNDESISLESHFKRWRKAQKTIRLAFECPVEKLDAVKTAIKAAGGKVA